MICLLKSAIFLGRLLDCQSISILSKCISINVPSTTSIFRTFHLSLSLSLYLYVYIYTYIDTHTGWPIIKTHASQWHSCDLRRPGSKKGHAHWVANHQDPCLPMAQLRPPTARKQEGTRTLGGQSSRPMPPNGTVATSDGQEARRDTHTGWPIIKTHASQWHSCDLRPPGSKKGHAHWVANHQDPCLPMAQLRPPTARKQEGTRTLGGQSSRPMHPNGTVATSDRQEARRDTHTGWPIIKTHASQWHSCDLRPPGSKKGHAHWVANHQDPCLPMAQLRPPTARKQDKNSACDGFDCDYLQSCLDAEIWPVRINLTIFKSSETDLFGKTFVTFELTSSGKMKIHICQNMPEIVMNARSRVVFAAVPLLRSSGHSKQLWTEEKQSWCLVFIWI